MALITGFSPRVAREVRRFFADHPVYRLKQRREIDMDSPPVRVLEGRCERCGLVMHPDPDTFPADTLRAVTMYHDWLLGRDKRCGGRISFSTEPVG